MRAHELRQLAEIYLANRYPDALIVPELSIGNWGKALIDLAAITADEIIGVEIKGEGDSATRLPLQAAVYSKAATRMFFLADQSLQSNCFKHIPDCWGRLTVNEQGQVTRWLANEWCKDKEPETLCTAPRQLLQCLWADELRDIARRHGVFATKSATVGTLLDCVSEDLPMKILRKEVCETLRRRQWINKPTVWAKFINARQAQKLGHAA